MDIGPPQKWVISDLLDYYFDLQLKKPKSYFDNFLDKPKDLIANYIPADKLSCIIKFNQYYNANRK